MSSISYPDKISVWNKALFIIIVWLYFDFINSLFPEQKVMSVIDYKYVNSVDVEQSCFESLNLAAEIDLLLLLWRLYFLSDKAYKLP